MRLVLVALVVAGSSTGCLAQDWEIGGGGGAGWSLDSSVAGGPNAVHTGYTPHGAFSVIWAENPYSYIGGELQYLFRAGGTELKSNGITQASSGYSNILVYNLTVHLTRRESKVRPFVGVGAGIKIYTNSERLLTQPLSGTALLLQGTQVEPAISFDGGVKYLLPRHVQLRLDLHAFTSPTPDALIRTIGPAHIKGWIYDLVPTAGIAYVF